MSDKKESKVDKFLENRKPSRLMMVLTKEYKNEGLILLLLALVAIVLGVLILVGDLSIPEDVFLLGDFPKVFAWILVGLGAFSLILAIWPFYKPSIDEVRRVNWPTKGIMLKNSFTVFMFVLILSVFYALADSLFSALVRWLDSLAGR